MSDKPKDRRTTEDAAPSAPEQQRRMGDRRDSIRVRMELKVRRPGQASFETFKGDVAIGGARVMLEHPPFGTRVEVALNLPNEPREIRVTGEVIRLTGTAGKYNAHIKFDELPVKDELAIARFLDEADEDEITHY